MGDGGCDGRTSTNTTPYPPSTDFCRPPELAAGREFILVGPRARLNERCCSRPGASSISISFVGSGRTTSSAGCRGHPEAEHPLLAPSYQTVQSDGLDETCPARSPTAQGPPVTPDPSSKKHQSVPLRFSPNCRDFPAEPATTRTTTQALCPTAPQVQDKGSRPPCAGVARAVPPQPRGGQPGLPGRAV